MAQDLKRFLREHFPGLSPELRRLLDSAVDNTSLVHADYLSIGDMLDIACYRDREPVFVLLLLMFLALEEGSLCVAAHQDLLRRRLEDLLPPAEARTWTERILHDLGSDGWHALVGRHPDDQRPVILHKVSDPPADFFYFHKFLRGELVFQRHVQARYQRESQQATLDWQPILTEVLQTQPWYVHGKPLQLDADQLLALRLALTKKLLVVSGGPGTGKTALVVTVLRCLLRAGFGPERLALAAPTGLAGQRLGDSLRQGLEGNAGGAHDPRLAEVQPTTLHQLLQYSPKRGAFRRHEENPIPADVVIIDEVSMVDVVIMAQLLQALKPDARLILLGDKDQLPSVQAGAVLSSLVPADSVNRYTAPTCRQLRTLLPVLQILEHDAASIRHEHVVLLRTNHRSQRHIREVAQAVNRQDLEVVERLPRLDLAADNAKLPEEQGCWLLEQTLAHAGEVRGVVRRWAERAYGSTYVSLVRKRSAWNEEDPQDQQLLQQVFRELHASRILTVLREGAWGCLSINGFLNETLRGHFDRHSRGLLFAGAPVLITANDHARRLYNGDVGVALPNANGLRVFFRRPGSFVSCAAESLPAHELGFALTVHKSQGSEYGRVLLILPATGGRKLLTKEILYTGITRAREQMILCATSEALRLALSRKIVRESGLFLS